MCSSIPNERPSDKVPVIQFVPVITTAVFMIACGVDCFAVIDFVLLIVLLARGSCDNCDISKKASKFKGFWGIVLFRTCIRDPELAVKKGTAR